MVSVDRPASAVAAKPVEISTLADAKAPNRKRISTGFSNFDYVMGGARTSGIRQPSIVLFGAMPGCGKSTVLLETMIRSPEKNSLYVAIEESPADLRERAERFDFGDRLDQIRVQHTRQIPEILAHVRELDAKLVIIDSLGEIANDETDTPDTASNYFRAVQSFYDEAHDHDRVFILVSHLNKAGEFYGARKVAHKIDTELMMERLGRTAYRRMYVEKNRNGPSEADAYFHMLESGLKAITREEGEMLMMQMDEDARLDRMEKLQEMRKARGADPRE